MCVLKKGSGLDTLSQVLCFPSFRTLPLGHHDAVGPPLYALLLMGTRAVAPIMLAKPATTEHLP
jgi:hypothetical protein